MTTALAKWHEIYETRDIQKLEELLDDNVVFHSPVVWTPQEGKHITKLYLTAAMHVLASEGSKFSYVREVINDKHMMLEFTCEVDGIVINGVDIIEVNEEGKIISFKVMVRPLKAMNMLHQKMGALLQMMKG